MKKFERLKDKENVPTDKLIKQTIGEKNYPSWQELKRYLDKAYKITPELIFYGEKYGWCYRYRKSGKTLCTLFPEKGAFTILITLGKQELEKLKPQLDLLTTVCRKSLKSAKQFHDGKWFWMRMPDMGNIEDMRTILQVKRKPS